MNQYIVYILASSTNHALYIGVTRELMRTVAEYRAMGSALPGQGPEKLVYYDPMAQAVDAIARKKQIQRWSWQKQVAFINAANPLWTDLSLSFDEDTADRETPLKPLDIPEPPSLSLASQDEPDFPDSSDSAAVPPVSSFQERRQPMIPHPSMEEMQIRLMVLQQEVRAKNIPVMLVFEGWGAAGKGTIISQLILNLDPRGFKVYSIQAPNEQEKRYPPMYRFWDKLPAYGQIAIFDRSWYRDVTLAPLYDKVGKTGRRFQSILDFEQQLATDGYVIAKFFLDITKKEQKSRFKELERHKATRWRVTDADWAHFKDHKKLGRRFKKMVSLTHKPYAPWFAIDARDGKAALAAVYRAVIAQLELALSRVAAPVVPPLASLPALPTISLHNVDLSPRMDVALYKSEVRAAQKKLKALHNKVYLNKVPVIVVFEGWDAAGKGSAIKRVAMSLDPRGYEVIPISAPSTLEKAHQYLWRFWNALPKDGHIAVFDRSWYGRVMVERIEGFCTPAAWQRAYDEINHFEQELTDWGAVVIKFWLHVSPQEQLARFVLRQNTPEKRWKITDEDWRNREKWPAYEEAVDEMLAKTHRENAPWIVVEANDKKYARVKVLKELIHAIEGKLGDAPCDKKKKR